MVEVRFPFSVLNNIPAVSGVDDVVVDIPEPNEVDDIVSEAIDTALETRDTILDIIDDDPDRWGDQLRQGLRDALFETGLNRVEPSPLLEDIAQAIAAEVDISGVTSDDIVAAVLDALGVSDGDIVLEIEGSLFAVEEDFVDLLVQAIEEADIGGVDTGGIDIPDLLDPIDELVDLVEGLESDILDLPGDVADEVTDNLGDAFIDALEDLPGGELLTDPEDFVGDLLDELGELLVSEEALDSLASTLEDL